MRRLGGKKGEEDRLYHLACKAMQMKSTVRCINGRGGNEARGIEKNVECGRVSS
jgi:hypothetical protein